MCAPESPTLVSQPARLMGPAEGPRPPQLNAEDTPENPGAIILSMAGARAPGGSIELRPSGSKTSSGSVAQLQRDWASAGEVSNGTAVGNMAPAVNSVPA